MPKKPSDEEGLFIRVNNPVLIRRNILESSKFVLTVLKQSYNLKQVREIKQIKMNELSQQIKELRMLVQKIEELMPQYTRADLKKLLPDIPIPKARKPSEPARAEKEKPEEKEEWTKELPKPAAPISEMDRITKALEDVQKKLQTL